MDPHDTRSNDGATRSWLLAASLALITAGVLLQALLAGLFLSGTSEARMTHLIVGAILPYLGIVPAVAAWVLAGRGAVTRRYAAVATLLLIALWTQEALGHMPFPVTTAIHVPLGVVLFAVSAQLAVLAARPRRRVGQPAVN